MNPMQKSYRAFIESVCQMYGRPEMSAPLAEGFSALCETRYTGPTQRLHHYIKDEIKRPPEMDRVAEQIVSEGNKHMPSGDALKLVNARTLLFKDSWIYKNFVTGLQCGLELANDENKEDDINFSDVDEPMDRTLVRDICSDCSSDDLPYTVEQLLAYAILHDRAVGENAVEDNISAALASGDNKQILMACAKYCPCLLLAPYYTGSCTEVMDGNDSENYTTEKTVLTYRNTLNDLWLIHFTTKENAESISINGFDRGNRLGGLAYNVNEDYTGNYMFGYALDSIDKIPGYWKGGAVVFRSSAVSVFHAEDEVIDRRYTEDSQYIFDKDVPDSFYLIIRKDKKTCDVVGKGDRVLFSGKLERCIQWLQKNRDTYAHMMYRSMND